MEQTTLTKNFDIKNPLNTKYHCPICKGNVTYEKKTNKPKYKWATYLYCPNCKEQFMVFRTKL